MTVGSLHLYVFAWRDGIIGIEAYSREDAEIAAGNYDTGLDLLYCKTIAAELLGAARVGFVAHLNTDTNQKTVLRTVADAAIMRRCND